MFKDKKKELFLLLTPVVLLLIGSLTMMVGMLCSHITWWVGLGLFFTGATWAVIIMFWISTRD